MELPTGGFKCLCKPGFAGMLCTGMNTIKQSDNHDMIK